MKSKIRIVGVLLCIPLMVAAQQQNKELDTLIEIALASNKSIQASLANVEAQHAQVRTAWDLGKTELYYNHDANNRASNDRALRVFGIAQEFQFPTIYATQRGVSKSKYMEQKAQHQLVVNQLSLAISQVYDDIVYLQNKEKLYQRIDSLYANFAKAGARKFELGEANYLEKLTSASKMKQVSLQLRQVQAQTKSAYEQLATLVQSDESLSVSNQRLRMFDKELTSDGRYWQEEYLNRVSHTFKKQLSLETQSWIPTFNVELFTGTNPTLDGHMHGFQIGVGIPLFFTSNIAKRKAALWQQRSWSYEQESRRVQMDRYVIQQEVEIEQLLEHIRYYQQEGKQLSAEILKTAEQSYKSGEIDYFQFIQSIENVTELEVNYLESVLAYNRACLKLYYFDFKA